MWVQVPLSAPFFEIFTIMFKFNKSIMFLVMILFLLISCATTRTIPAPIENGVNNQTLVTKLPIPPLNNNKADGDSQQINKIDNPQTAQLNDNKCYLAKDKDGFIFPTTSWQLYKKFNPELKGVNLKAPYATDIYAAKDGKVVYSGDGLVGYGNMIIIKHDDGLLSAYAFNQVNIVKTGDLVKQCQTIAKVGYMNNTISGLHFEIRKNGKPLNPIEVITDK